MDSEDIQLQLLQQLPGLIVVMDQNSKFIYSNEYTAKMFGYKNENVMLGIDAYDMRCPASESASQFIDQDRIVMKNNTQVNILDIHGYADGTVKILITKKAPFKNADQPTGVICHCMEIQSTFLRDLSKSIISADQHYLGKEHKPDRSYIIGNPQNQEQLLTPREQDCLFYLLRGLTGKQIAKQLNLSPRTVETHLNNIKLRLRCESKADIIEYGVSNGYLNYIPEKLFSSSS